MTRRQALIALSVWLVGSVALAASDARPSVIVLFGIIAVVAAVIVVVLDLRRQTASIEWHRPRGGRRPTPGADERVTSLHNQLYNARSLRSDELRVALVELVDDRLLAHRHIDRAADPAAAMEALTPTLRRLVSGQRRPGTTVRELDRILTDIEAL
ncbi:MAG TPA: hypothetical protein VFE86_00995 [Ilumatobacteraceae bacterium]|nr:hypothetical protein [Ilumatobacteraceae bacterium]